MYILFNVVYYLDVIHQSKSDIVLDLGLELLGQPAVAPHILLEPSHSKVSDNKPEFQ